MLSLKEAFIAAVLCAVVTFLTRLFPFVLFRGVGENSRFKFVQRYIPPMTMVILVAYCFKDVDMADFGIPLFSAVFTAAVHILLKNPLASIFSGTAIYMILIRFFS
jgi:branched-subunit amino acid transport protein AzlD